VFRVSNPDSILSFQFSFYLLFFGFPCFCMSAEITKLTVASILLLVALGCWPDSLAAYNKIQITDN